MPLVDYDAIDITLATLSLRHYAIYYWIAIDITTLLLHIITSLAIAHTCTLRCIITAADAAAIIDFTVAIRHIFSPLHITLSLDTLIIDSWLSLILMISHYAFAIIVISCHCHYAINITIFATLYYYHAIIDYAITIDT